MVGLGWRRSCLFWVIIILASFAWLFKSTDITLEKWSSWGQVQGCLCMQGSITWRTTKEGKLPSGCVKGQQYLSHRLTMPDHALCFLPMVSFYVIFGDAKCSRNSMTRYCKESRQSELTMKIWSQVLSQSSFKANCQTVLFIAFSLVVSWLSQIVTVSPFLNVLNITYKAVSVVLWSACF